MKKPQPYKYASYEMIDTAIKNHERFIHHIGHNKDRRHYSLLKDGHYKVYTQVEGGSIMLLDMIGDKVLHVDKTYYADGKRIECSSPIDRLQKIIWKYYG